MKFTKITAQGNDYLYFDYLEEKEPKLNMIEFAKKYSNRYFGVGSDGIVWMLPSKKADLKMRIWNADGTEAKMCGSALRSVVMFYGQKYSKEKVLVETNSGIKSGKIIDFAKKIVEVNMGEVEFLNYAETIAIQMKTGYQIDVGNPHFVIFDEDNIFQLGKQISENPFFINGTNVELVKIISKDEIDIKIWERGSGATLACGTGATASAAIAMKKFKLDNRIKVNMPGGNVFVKYNKISGDYFLSGEVDFICEGNLFV
jgi:diaminopimelate epimerase